MSYRPHSGSVLTSFSEDDLRGFSASEGALKIPVGAELPDDLLRRLIAARRAEASV